MESSNGRNRLKIEAWMRDEMNHFWGWNFCCKFSVNWWMYDVRHWHVKRVWNKTTMDTAYRETTKILVFVTIDRRPDGWELRIEGREELKRKAKNALNESEGRWKKSRNVVIAEGRVRQRFEREENGVKTCHAFQVWSHVEPFWYQVDVKGKEVW